MKLYLDVIFLINIWFDLLILLSVSILLKRNIKFKRIILGSLFGGLTIFILFYNLNSLELFLYKIIVSIFMVIITFSYNNLKYTFSNLSYFYLVSIILGGGMYLLNDSFLANNGFVFQSSGVKLNYFLLIILSPIIIYIFLKESKKLKDNYSNYHKVDILYHNRIYHLNGFLDTGNHLYDPFKKRKVILVKLKLEYKLEDVILVPFESLNNVGVIKCLKVDKLFVDKKEFNNCLIGLSSEKFKIEGIDCILHSNMKGELM